MRLPAGFLPAFLGFVDKLENIVAGSAVTLAWVFGGVALETGDALVYGVTVLMIGVRVAGDSTC